MKVKAFIRKGIAGLLATAMLTAGAAADTKEKSASNGGGEVQGSILISLPTDPNWGKITAKGEEKIQQYEQENNYIIKPVVPGAPDILHIPEKADEIWIYDYSKRPGAYQITQQDEIQAIQKILSETNASYVKYDKGYYARKTGIDAAEYIPLWGLSIGNDVFLGFRDDTYILSLFGKTGEYRSDFYKGKEVDKVTKLLQTIAQKHTPVYRAFDLPEQHSLFLYDNQKKLYSDADDASVKIRRDLDQAFRALRPQYVLNGTSLGKPCQGIDNMVAYLPDGTSFEYSFYENGIAVTSSLTEIGLEQEQSYAFVGEEYQTLLNAVKQASSGVPKHPYWLGKLVNRNTFYSVSTLNPEARSNIEYKKLQEILATAAVSAEGYQSAKPSAILSNPQISFQIEDTSTYTITVSDTQLKIANDSVDYATLYRLTNGKELAAALKKALAV